MNRKSFLIIAMASLFALAGCSTSGTTSSENPSSENPTSENPSSESPASGDASSSDTAIDSVPSSQTRRTPTITDIEGAEKSEDSYIYAAMVGETKTFTVLTSHPENANLVHLSELLTNSDPSIATITISDWAYNGTGLACTVTASCLAMGSTTIAFNDLSNASLVLTVFVPETDNTLTINYVFPDGTEASTAYTGTYEEGDEYSISSPDLDFYEADIENVSGTMGSESVIKTVTYSYSFEKEVKTLSRGDHFDNIYVDTSKGISLNYAISGNTSDWAPLFKTVNITIYQAVMRLQKESNLDWYEGPYAMDGYSWNALLSSADSEYYVSVSFNPDGSLSIYRDGNLAFFWASDTICGNQDDNRNGTMSELVTTFMEEVADTGLDMASAPISGESDINYVARRLTIDYALDDISALAKYSLNAKFVGKFYDDDGNAAHGDYIYYGLPGDSFSLPTPSLPGYVCDKESFSGIYGTDTSDSATYSFDGVQQLEEGETITLNTSGVAAWRDNITDLVKGLTGDFSVQIKFNNKSDYYSSGGEICWRTFLAIVEDASTLNRGVFRYDWAGWMDTITEGTSAIATRQDIGTMWLDNYEDITKIFPDMDVTLLISRSGETVTLSHMIYPNSEEMAGQSYSYTQHLYGVTSETLNLRFSAECANISVTSIKIANL